MTELLNRMKQRIAEWEAEEPQEDWWQYQHEYAEAAYKIAVWNKHQPQTDALREKINDIKEAWDWWQVDTYDRCASVVEDAINAALEQSK